MREPDSINEDGFAMFGEVGVYVATPVENALIINLLVFNEDQAEKILVDLPDAIRWSRLLADRQPIEPIETCKKK